MLEPNRFFFYTVKFLYFSFMFESKKMKIVLCTILIIFKFLYFIFFVIFFIFFVFFWFLLNRFNFKTSL